MLATVALIYLLALVLAEFAAEAIEFVFEPAEKLGQAR